jgi:hypothetical protein
MTNDTQLPAEVHAEALAKAKDYMSITNGNAYETGKRNGFYDGYIACAIKLHECDKANKALEETNRGLTEENESLTNQLKNQSHVHKDNMILLKQENEKARTLLEKFISRHESDTMSWEFINEIKSFLNETK